MELLAATYASSEEDEDEEADDARPREHQRLVESHSQFAPSAVHEAVAADTPVVRRLDEAARAAVAKRFALRAQNATHCATADEHRYAYRPYTSKRQNYRAQGCDETPGGTASSHKGPNVSPLFSTLRALPTPIDANSQHVKSFIPTTDSDLPVWQKRRRMQSHTGAVNCLQWNPRYPPVFLSASMDHNVRVWLLPREYYDSNDSDGSTVATDSPQCQRVLTHHTRGVKSAKWSIDGRHLWSGSFDGDAAYVDVERASVVQRYTHHTNEHITSVLPHPADPQFALCGTNRGRILQRDLRMDASSPPAAIYGTKTTGEIHDLLFLPSSTAEDSEYRFVSSSSLTARDTSHQTLLVWDLRSTILLADHLNNDLCSFTSLYLHPNHRHFVAQSTISELVLFSALPPYKRLKPKRSFHSGHDVQGFSVGCSFNAKGSLLASGDVNGRIVLYSAATHRVLKQYQVYSPSIPCLAVAFHPQWSSTLISGGYDGRIDLFDHMASTS